LSRVVSLLGSPSARSRSGALLAQLEARLTAALGDDAVVDRIALRDLPAGPLLAGDSAEPQIAAAVAAVRSAQLVLVATPIYKAAYSGLLKAFLDLLPQDALRGKTVVPLATGGSIAHLLALDYALKPVLGALGAHDIRAPIFATDAQLPADAGGHMPVLDLQHRLDRTLGELMAPAAGWWLPRAAHAGAAEPPRRLAASRAEAVTARCTT
jgi:FMN reductase